MNNSTRSHKYRIDSVLVFILMTFTCAAKAQEFTVSTNSGSITIIGYTGPGGAVIIPEMINSLPVKTIGSDAFFKNHNITSVTIASGVTGIEERAFQYCSSMTSILIPNSVAYIGVAAFQGSSLQSIDLPSSISRIEDALCRECYSLTNATIPNGVVSIGGSSFSHCPELKSIIIPDSVTIVEGGAFYECFGLANVTLGANMKSIETGAFNTCSSLTNISMQDGITSIGPGTFYKCSNLFGLTMPHSITSIGYNAFYKCGLTNITLPACVSNIEEGAFLWCINLKSISVPDGVASINQDTFGYCTNLTTVSLGKNIGNIDRYAFLHCGNLTQVCFRGNAPIIAETAFANADNVTLHYLPWTLGWGPILGGRLTQINPEYINWLTTFNFPNDRASDYLDPDNDCIPNWQEYLDGMNPLFYSIGTGYIAITNDQFENASVIFAERGTLFATNVTATSQEGELPHAGHGPYASLWWQYTPKTDGTLNINTHGSSFDTVIGVYSGTAPNNVVELESNDDDGSTSNNSGIWGIPLNTNEKYMIAVDCSSGFFGYGNGYRYGYGYGFGYGYGYGYGGKITLNWAFNPYDGGTEYKVWTTNFWPESNSGGSTNDCDDDGVSNFEEWLAGTNPTNKYSVLEIESISVSVNGPTVSWSPVLPDRLYDLYWSTNLNHGFSKVIPNMYALEPGVTVTDTVHRATMPAGFYKIGVRR